MLECANHCCTPTTVQIVVVAEDGVTTNRYPIRFMVVEQNTTGSQPLSVSAARGVGMSSSGSSSASPPAGSERNPSWPLPPAMQPGCSICPRGWAAGGGERSCSCLLGLHQKAAALHAHSFGLVELGGRAVALCLPTQPHPCFTPPPSPQSTQQPA